MKKDFSIHESDNTEILQKNKLHINRLSEEKSPYLLQHANNPVDWHPWGKAAFEKAQKEDKPIFLSIGYSTCHWCHVMAHESFEDSEIARLMNETFISIKVDREERPDIDKIYMNVCQMLTGGGGWPLTIVMTSDKKPFFAGTYFPKTSRFGRIGMFELISRIKEFWNKQKVDLLKSADRITDLLKHMTSNSLLDGDLGEPTLRLAYEQLNQRFDRIYGGFGNAPKFPTPHNLTFLLRYWKRYNISKSKEMVEKTLKTMRLGGIYDHIGYGFHRYSTDHKWFLPHFEKMLYDQALLALTYIEAYQATKNEEYKKIAQEIFTYVLRDMTSSEGGFYSAEDADSEGIEGKFYLWTKDEIQKILDKETADLIINVFNIEEKGNFTEEATGYKSGGNILYLKKPLNELAVEFKISEIELQKRVEVARQKLFEYREKRIHPHKDDKILTNWNGLMIAALAKGAQVFNNKNYLEAAERAVNFILNNLYNTEERLLHRYRDNKSEILAYLDDYSFFIWALLELYETTFNVKYLEIALNLNDDLLKHFWDNKDGGFFFTADDGEKLIIRQNDIYDGAIPSGNSIAMFNLLRIAKIKNSSDLIEKAAKIGRFFANSVNQSPSAYTQLMNAVDFAIGPSYVIVIAGILQNEDTRKMLNVIRKEFIPNKIVILRPADQESPTIDNIAEAYKFQNSLDGKATSYVCENYTCKPATTDIKKVLELLNLNNL
jgi:uncharacterized protein YyaL (SSP411 family)